ncbi:hypothetical protein NC652_003872 [Populus alba x Populus x berolinensis]|uniref:Uncharacterized protein n=1 Tax=Populus alba x Populus x berolinensis TaxID=444605 RepID=A0AAD6WJA8_9ROSI|nr:hypothetical protein NC652_003872 [Populus alba x Populus x berolinensis]KAJ7014422.1 hypothetical protein NC653_003898 [Populus alba x Populus x berolinensis]
MGVRIPMISKVDLLEHLVLASIWCMNLMLHKKKWDLLFNCGAGLIALSENVLLVLFGGFAFCFDLGVFSFREGISEARVHCILSFSCDETSSSAPYNLRYGTKKHAMHQSDD